MTQPGWFPDPGGQKGMFRYWDGTTWTQQLSANPPTSGPGKGNKAGPILALVATVIVLALIAVFLLPRVLGGTEPTPGRPPPTGSPTISGWDESTRPSPTPTPTPTRPPETSLPCPEYDQAVVNGRLYGGGLSVPTIDDSRWSVNEVRSIPWAICATGLRRSIAAEWVSEVILAGVQPGSLTGSLQEQANAIAEDSVDRFYRGGDATMTTDSSKATTVDGLQAWEVHYTVRIDYLGDIPGDKVNLLVVQHGDGSRSVLMTFATIGDTATQRAVDRCRTGITVEKR